MGREAESSATHRRRARLLVVGAALATLGCTPGPETTTKTAENVVAAPGSSAAAPSSAGPATPARPPPSAINAGRCLTDPRVDDLEDGDAKIVAADQRSGSWFTDKDKVGSTIEPAAESPFTPTAGGAEGSKYATRIRGKTAARNDPHAGVGIRFVDGPGAYDLACCRGISFWAKKGKGSIDVFRLTVGDVNTVAEGGVCKECSNELGVDLGLTDEWKQYTIEFAWMRQQPYWGDRSSQLALDRVFHVRWQTTYKDHEYELWVDDVRMVGCGGH